MITHMSRVNIPNIPQRHEFSMSEKKVYFNKPQRLTQFIGANTTIIVAGRRIGKTDSIAAPFVLRNMQRMPGSTSAIVVPTFKHGLTNTIPACSPHGSDGATSRVSIMSLVGNRPNRSVSLSSTRKIMNTSYLSTTVRSQ